MVGSSAIFTPEVTARAVTPPNMTTARVPIAVSVTAALRDFGTRKNGTPLLTASTPVKAVHPDANARMSRKIAAAPVASTASTE